jgi:hypothetical protein
MKVITYARALRIQAREQLKWASMGIQNVLSCDRDKVNRGGDKSSRGEGREAEKRKGLSDDADLSSIATIFIVTVTASDGLQYIKVHWKGIPPSPSSLTIDMVMGDDITKATSKLRDDDVWGLTEADHIVA